MQRNDLQPIHPLFPVLDTNLNASQFEEQIYSDHLPIMLEKAGLKVLSYNIQGFNAADNLRRMPNIQGGFESLQIVFKREKARYQRDVEVMARAVGQNGINVIGLQEASFDFELKDATGNVVESYDLISSVLDRLGRDDWAVSFGGEGKAEERKGIVTFYKTTELDFVDDHLDTNDRVISTTFIVKSSQKTVHAHNIWGNYSDDPRPMEATIKKYLERHLGEEAIMFGDTNSRIASLSDQPMNLTTGVIPPAFNEASYGITNRELQLPDHPDGGFYIDVDGNIHQLEHHLLHPQTGKIYFNEQDVDNFILSLSEEQINVFTYPRAILSLDHQLKNAKYFPKASTISEYESYLQALLKDPRLMVSYEATALNKKGVCVRLHKPNNALLNNLEEYGFWSEKKAMANGAMKPFIHIEFNQLSIFDDLVHGREPVIEEAIEELSEKSFLSSVSMPTLVGVAVGAVVLGTVSVLAMVFAWPVFMPVASLFALSTTALTSAFGGSAIAATAAGVISATGIGSVMAAVGGFVGGVFGSRVQRIATALRGLSEDDNTSPENDPGANADGMSLTRASTVGLLESMPVLPEAAKSAGYQSAQVVASLPKLEQIVVANSQPQEESTSELKAKM